MAESDYTLLRVASEALFSLPDEIGCDECAEHLPAYAEALVRRRKLPVRLRQVADHLDRCPECREEWNCLQKALRAAGRRR